MPFDPSAFDTPPHYVSRWSAPHRDRLTAFPGENPAWKDAPAAAVIRAELARRGLDLADIQITRGGDLTLVAGPEHITWGVDTLAAISDGLDATEMAERLRGVLDMTLANVARERMMAADGWRDGDPLPAWSLQTTPILQALMALGGYKPADLLRTYPLGWSEGRSLTGGDTLHGDARDALPVEVDVTFDGVSLMLIATCDAFMLTQHDETMLYLADTGLGIENRDEWIGHRVGELADLGPGPLQDLLGQCVIRDVSVFTPDGRVVATLSMPIVTLAPIPDAVLAAVGMADVPPAAARFPLWTAVKRLPPSPKSRTIPTNPTKRIAKGELRSKDMARKKSTGKAVVPVNEPERDVVHHLIGSGEPIRVEAVYRVPAVHPKDPGPWSAEADKIAWIEPMSGYGCIIRRSPSKGHLCGYVAVGPDHPLYRWTANALIGLHVGVHGGVSYAKACQAWEPEETSVCHVVEAMQRIVADEPGQVIHRTEPKGDDAWWFGFECDGPGDVLPGNRMLYANAGALDGVVERAYRDEAYVHGECVRLAAQLKAVADGRDPIEALARGRFPVGDAPVQGGE